MEKQNTTQDVINDIINPYSEYAKGFYDGVNWIKKQEQEKILEIIENYYPWVSKYGEICEEYQVFIRQIKEELIQEISKSEGKE
jgi:hypothetical protein